MELLGLLGDAGHLARAVGGLLVLGMALAFSPTTFGIEIGAVEDGRRTRARVIVIAAAVALAATLLAVLFVLVSPNTLHALWTGRVRTILTQRWFDAAVGLLLIMVGSVQWRRARRPRRPRPPGRLERPRVLFGVVLANSLLSTTSPATMYLVVRTIGTTRPVLWLPEYVIFLIGLALPYTVLAVALTRIPPFARRVAAATAALSRRDLRRPLAVVIIVVGLALLVWSSIALVRAS